MFSRQKKKNEIWFIRRIEPQHSGLRYTIFVFLFYNFYPLLFAISLFFSLYLSVILSLCCLLIHSLTRPIAFALDINTHLIVVFWHFFLSSSLPFVLDCYYCWCCCYISIVPFQKNSLRSMQVNYHDKIEKTDDAISQWLIVCIFIYIYLFAPVFFFFFLLQSNSFNKINFNYFYGPKNDHIEQ